MVLSGPVSAVFVDEVCVVSIINESQTPNMALTTCNNILIFLTITDSELV